MCFLALLLCMPLVAQINPPVLNTPGGVIQNQQGGLNGSGSNLGGDKLQLYGATISPQQVPALQGGQTVIGGHITPLQTPNTVIAVPNPNVNGSISAMQQQADCANSYNTPWGVFIGGNCNDDDDGDDDDGDEDDGEDDDVDLNDLCNTPTISVQAVSTGDCACDFKFIETVNNSNCSCLTTFTRKFYVNSVQQDDNAITVNNGEVTINGGCDPNATYFYEVDMNFSGTCAIGMPGMSGATGAQASWTPSGDDCGGGTPTNTGEEEEEGTLCSPPSINPVVILDESGCPCDFQFTYQLLASNCQCNYSVNENIPTINSCEGGTTYTYTTTLNYWGDCAGGNRTKKIEKEFEYTIPGGSVQPAACNDVININPTGNCPCQFQIDLDVPEGAEIVSFAITDWTDNPTVIFELLDEDYIGSPNCPEYEGGIVGCVSEIPNSINFDEINFDSCLEENVIDEMQIEVLYIHPVTEELVTISVSYQPDNSTLCGLSPEIANNGFESNKTDETSLLSNSNNLVSISPNPASDMVNIDLPEAAVDQFVNIQISDLSGKSFTIYSGANKLNQIGLDLQNYNLNNGLYLLNIQYGSTNTSHKLMITK